MMVEAKVRSLKDQSLFTGVEELYLFQGQVFTAIFKNADVLEGLEKIGVLEIVDDDVPEQKEIPVLFSVSEIAEIEEPPCILLDAHGNEIPLHEYSKEELR